LAARVCRKQDTRTYTWQGGDTFYEKNGERYFVVDGHIHYDNAAPDN